MNKIANLWKVLLTGLVVAAITMISAGCAENDDSSGREHPASVEHSSDKEHSSDEEHPTDKEHPTNSERSPKTEHPD